MTDTDDTHGMQATESTESAVDEPRPLDGLVTSIRAATAPDAPAEVRATAAAACRSLLAALEAKQGEPLTAPRAAMALPAMTATPAATAAPAPAAAAPSHAPASPILAVIAQLRSMPRDQLSAVLKQLVTSPSSPFGGLLTQLAEMPRDQLIARVNQQLRTLAPAGAPIPPPTGPRFHLIPIPQVSRRGGAR